MEFAYGHDYVKLVKCFNIDKISDFLKDEKAITMTLLFESLVETTIGNGKDVFDIVFSIGFFPSVLCKLVMEYLPKKNKYDVILIRDQETISKTKEEYIIMCININSQTYQIVLEYAFKKLSPWFCNLKTHSYMKHTTFIDAYTAFFDEKQYDLVNNQETSILADLITGNNMLLEIAVRIPYNKDFGILMKNINVYLAKKGYLFEILDIHTFLLVLATVMTVYNYINTNKPVEKCLIM